jgi:hypothetical protein
MAAEPIFVKVESSSGFRMISSGSMRLVGIFFFRTGTTGSVIGGTPAHGRFTFARSSANVFAIVNGLFTVNRKSFRRCIRISYP